MLNKQSKAVWYGVLETPVLTTEVIYDPTLPCASSDKIYLYNAQREQMVLYVWHIVQPLLRELDAGQAEQVKKSLDKPWKKARKAFIADRAVVSQPPVVAKRKPAPKEDEMPTFDEPVDLDIDDGFGADYDSV